MTREAVDTAPVDPVDGNLGALASDILVQEDRRRAATQTTERIELPDDLLPGVGGDAPPLRRLVGIGGFSTLAVLTSLNLVDEFDRVALAVLGPEIQESLGMSDTVLAATASVSGLLFVVGAVPLGYLADRMRRTHLTALTTALWAVIGMLTGAVHAVWQLVVLRLFSGLGKANVLPVHNSLLADTYPIEARSRVFAVHALANPVGIALGPLLAGAIAALAGGEAGWRWSFVALTVPALVLAAAAAALREPPRGRHEQTAVLGEALEAGNELPIPLGAGFARLKKIRTFYFFLIGVGVLGYALTSVPLFLNLLLEDRFGYDAWERGVFGSLTAFGSLVGVPLGGTLGDRLFRRDPPRMVLLIAGCLGAHGLVLVAALYLPGGVVPLGIGVALGLVLLNVALVPVNTLVAAVAPYRMRALAFSMVGIYIFFVGGFFGGVLTGLISDAVGERTALAIVVPPSCLIGAALIAYGARFVRGDVSLVVQELREERSERARMAATGDVPLLQVRNLDFSYGPLQVLFDVALDVRRGEVLALLGTNGAGKSTLLKCISGLGLPDRGVVRLDGRTITYAEAETRVRLGIVQVPGGKAVFPDLSVRENLLVGAYTYLRDDGRVDERVGRVLDLFPKLGDRLDQQAGTLSGGEQQMLAIAKALLLDPTILLVDELSLGLAPVVVQEILASVDRLKAEGITMVVVEQSVNVALSIADRAVFMEKGEVRFEGAAADLLARDDLLRAVFLGAGAGG